MGDELEVCSGRGRNRENGSTENQKQKGGRGGPYGAWLLCPWASILGEPLLLATTPTSANMLLKVTFSNEPIYR